MNLLTKLFLVGAFPAHVYGASFAGQTLAFAAPTKLPSVKIMRGFPDPDMFDVAEYCAGKNVVIVGLPGAFTPT